MWIFTPEGFISAVQHKDDPDTIVVRARSEDHLTELFPEQANQIIDMDWADYPHRLHMSRARFKTFMQDQADALDYADFKSSIAAEQAVYRDTCADVWVTMHRLQR